MKLFLRAKSVEQPDVLTLPHCDARILHAPGECEFCDLHPEWQHLRDIWGIAYSGHDPVIDAEHPWLSQVPCPSEVRHRETVNRWPGNRAHPPDPRPPSMLRHVDFEDSEPSDD